MSGEHAKNVVLLGYRGSGKSCVARLVAERLGWAFVDTDELIEQHAGCTICEIFEQRGEAAFRALEAEVIAGLPGAGRRVISVGGGAVLAEENRRRLRATGHCIWLTAPAEELCRRITADPQTASRRPALTTAAGKDEVQQLLAVRAPLYAATAHDSVDTSGRSPEQVADLILRLLMDNAAGAR